MGAIHKMIKCLETQVREAKDSMNDARQYGVNSAGFNAYMGQFEMATTLLEEAQRLAEEEGLALENKKLSDLQGVGCGTTDKDVDALRNEWDKEKKDGTFCGIRLQIMDVVAGNISTGKAVSNILWLVSQAWGRK